MQSGLSRNRNFELFEANPSLKRTRLRELRFAKLSKLLQTYSDVSCISLSHEGRGVEMTLWFAQPKMTWKAVLTHAEWEAIRRHPNFPAS